MQDPMVVVNRDGRIQAANHPFTSLAGIEEKTLAEKKIWDYLEIREEGQKHFLGRGQAITGMVCHLKAGARPELMVSVLKIPQVCQAESTYVFILRDISKQKWLAGMIRYNATHDPLTGLANRAFFLRKLQ
jgi:PAS domain S-box-containing protein